MAEFLGWLCPTCNLCYPEELDASTCESLHKIAKRPPTKIHASFTPRGRTVRAPSDPIPMWETDQGLLSFGRGEGSS